MDRTTSLISKSSHVIPAVIRKMVDAQESGAPYVTLFGDGSPTREFLFVRDAAEGIVRAAEHYNGAEPVNLGSAFEISIRDLVEIIADEVGFTAANCIGIPASQTVSRGASLMSRAPSVNSASSPALTSARACARRFSGIAGIAQN